MPDYRVAVRFDRQTQKHHATSTEIPGLDVSDMNVERLFTKVAQAAPALLRAAGEGSDGDFDFNLKFEKVES
jgi:hypothetical protein